MKKPKTVKDANADIATLRKLAERVLCTLGERSKTIRSLCVKTLMVCSELEELRGKVT